MLKIMRLNLCLNNVVKLGDDKLFTLNNEYLNTPEHKSITKAGSILTTH